jgi:hypothetical protein
MEGKLNFDDFLLQKKSKESNKIKICRWSRNFEENSKINKCLQSGFGSRKRARIKQFWVLIKPKFLPLISFSPGPELYNWSRPNRCWLRGDQPFAGIFVRLMLR